MQSQAHVSGVLFLALNEYFFFYKSVKKLFTDTLKKNWLGNIQKNVQSVCEKCTKTELYNRQ